MFMEQAEDDGGFTRTPLPTYDMRRRISKDGRDEATFLRAPHLCRFSLNEQLHKAVEVRLKYFQRLNHKCQSLIYSEAICPTEKTH